MPLIAANDDELSPRKVSQHDNLRIVVMVMVLPLMVLLGLKLNLKMSMVSQGTQDHIIWNICILQ